MTIKSLKKVLDIFYGDMMKTVNGIPSKNAEAWKATGLDFDSAFEERCDDFVKRLDVSVNESLSSAS